MFLSISIPIHRTLELLCSCYIVATHIQTSPEGAKNSRSGHPPSPNLSFFDQFLQKNRGLSRHGWISFGCMSMIYDNDNDDDENIQLQPQISPGHAACSQVLASFLVQHGRSSKLHPTPMVKRSFTAGWVQLPAHELRWHPSDRAERRCTGISLTSRTTQLVRRPPWNKHDALNPTLGVRIIQWNRREGTKGFPESMILHYWNCVATLWAHGHGPISLNTNASSTSMFSNHPWHMLGRRCPQGTLCRNLGRKRLRDAFSQILWQAPHRLLLSGLPNHWSKGSCEAKQCFERAATLTCVIWRKTQSYAIICNLLDFRLCEKQSAHKHTT